MEIKLTQWFVYEWGKLTLQKSHRMILRSTLPRIHYYQNKRLQVKESQYLIPTHSWTFTPKPNWTYSVMTIFPFQCMTLNMQLNHQREKRKLKHTFTDWMKINYEKLNFINLNRYPICRAVVEPRAEIALLSLKLKQFS